MEKRSDHFVVLGGEVVGVARVDHLAIEIHRTPSHGFDREARIEKGATDGVCLIVPSKAGKACCLMVRRGKDRIGPRDHTSLVEHGHCQFRPPPFVAAAIGVERSVGRDHHAAALFPSQSYPLRRAPTPNRVDMDDMRAKRAKLLSNGVATGSHTDLNAQLFLDGGQRGEIG